MTVIFESECSRLTVYNRLNHGAGGDMGAEIREGLTSWPKYIPSKYFYDVKGSKIFEEICLLPEYYQTRAEMKILESFAPRIMKGFADGDLVELGSGANWKIKLLIDSMLESNRSTIRYVPVDISDSALIKASSELLDEYPDLQVRGIVADFNYHMGGFETGRKKMFLFLGSTIGNMDEDKSVGFLGCVAQEMEPGDQFLLGLDLIKPVERLEAAYNDKAGVTARFNKNILNAINKELNADFKVDAFEHVAFYDSEKERVEMWLKALRPVEARINDIGLTVRFDEGETTLTEICRKFTRQSAEKMIAAAGLEITCWMTDPKEWFALAMLAKRRSGS